MATSLNTAFFNSKELNIALKLDSSNVGTAASGASGWNLVESESVTPPTFNDLTVERRAGAGSGIFTEETDFFKYTPGAIIECSVSGLLTDEIFKLLIQLGLGSAFSTNVISIDNNSTNLTFEHNASAAANKTFSVAYNGAVGNDSIVIPGCVATSLTISGDPNEDGGRMTFEMTAQSRTPVAAGAFSTAVAASDTLSSNYTFLGDFSNHTWLMDAEVLLKSFSMTVENPVTFAGYGGSGGTGAPQTYIRSVPEMSVMINPVVKYDTNLDGLWDIMRESAATASLAEPAFEMADNATYTDGNRAIRVTNARLDSLSWDEGDYLGLNVGLKLVGGTSPDLYIKYV
tara:strand:+ start:1416 stop:2447 length:1032 start_codon:yes stop_codon:yes gene_type:complete